MTSKNKTLVIAEPGKQEFFIVREFDAPGSLVFKAFSDGVVDAHNRLDEMIEQNIIQ